MAGRSIHAMFAAAVLSAALSQSVASQSFFLNADAPKAEARLIAGWTEPDGKRVAGLRIELADGWKTYWRSPGEAGIPPTFNWDGSENVADVQIDWPTPIVFYTYGLRTIGYKDEMTLPLLITPKDASKPVRLRLELFYGVCEDICVPSHAEMSLDLPTDAPAREAASIRAAMDTAPLPANTAGLMNAQCFFNGEEFTARLSFAPMPVAAPVVVIEGQQGVWFSPLESRIDREEIVARGEMRADPGQWIDRSALQITLLNEHGGRGLSVKGCPKG